MTKDEALKLALALLELHNTQYPDRVKGYFLDVITAIKEALAQPEQETLAWEQFYPDMGKPQLAPPHPWEKFCDSNCVWTDHHPDCKLAQPEQTNTRPYYTIDELNEWADEKEKQAWRNAAIRIGEELSSVGPDGYYDMDAWKWLDWAMEQEPRGKTSLAQPEQDNAYIYASNLAKTIWQKHYMKESPKFALLDTTEGVLTQIDNMTCGLVREKPAQPEQEPVACVEYIPCCTDQTCQKCKAAIKPELVCVCGAVWEGQELIYTPPQRTWAGMTDEDKAFCVQTTAKRGSTYELIAAIEAKLKEKNT